MTPYEHLEFNALDYLARYGLDYLTADAAKAFAVRLALDVEM